jgi:hypothetical protein
MKSQVRPLVLLALYAALGVPGPAAALAPADAAPSYQEVIFPLALSHREDLAKRIESCQATAQDFPATALSPLAAVSGSLVLDAPALRGGTELLYALMSLRR